MATTRTQLPLLELAERFALRIVTTDFVIGSTLERVPRAPMYDFVHPDSSQEDHEPALQVLADAALRRACLPGDRRGLGQEPEALGTVGARRPRLSSSGHSYSKAQGGTPET